MRLDSTFNRSLCALAGAVMVSACSQAPVQSYRLGAVSPSAFGQASFDPAGAGELSAPLGPGIFYALPKSLIKVTINRGKKDHTRFTVANNIVPDASAVYRAIINTSPFAHDTIAIQVDASMLLQSVNSKNKDQSVEISEKVVTLVQDVAVGLSEAAPGEEEVVIKPLIAEVHFDPFDPAAACESALQADVGLSVTNLGANSFTCLGGSHTLLPAPESAAADVGASVADLPADCSKGVCFRLVRPAILRVTDTDPDTSTTFVSEHVAIVPDPDLGASYDISRAACVEKDTKLTFSDGLLTKADIIKPSEVLNCLSIPAQVVAAVLGFPEAVNARKSAQLQSEKDLIDKRIALIDAQQRLIDKQDAAMEKKQ